MDRKKIGKGRGLLVLVLMSCSLYRCVDPIPFETEAEIPKMVVFGTFTQQSKDHEITINQTGNFGTIGSSIGGAIVEIINEEGERAQYIEREEGHYILPEGEMCGEPGKAYKLFVALGTRQFESSWEVMPDPVEIEDMRLEVNFRERLSNSDVLIKQFILDAFIDTSVKTAAGNKAFVRWQTEEVWTLLDFNCGPFDPSKLCFYRVDNKFTPLTIFRSIDDSQQRLENYLVFSRTLTPYIEFTEKHYINVRQYSIAESTFEYWDRINIVSNPSGSIFDKVPAAVQGNIEQVNGDLEVLGYFEVASISYGRSNITLSEINKYIQIPKACNSLYPPFFQPDYCCFCDLLPGTIPRPDWLDE